MFPVKFNIIDQAVSVKKDFELTSQKQELTRFIPFGQAVSVKIKFLINLEKVRF